MKDNILIIRLSGIGDVIATLPLLSALRKAYPDAHIAWLVSKKAYDVLKGNPYLDDILVFRKGIKNYISCARALSARGFNIVLDPQSQLRSGVLSLLSGARRRIGFARGVSKEPNSIFLTEKVKPLPEEAHIVDRDLSLLRQLGIKAGKAEFMIKLEPEDESYIEEFITNNGLSSSRLVGLCLAGTLRNRKWPNMKWAELIDRIADVRNLKPVIIWGPEEHPDVEEIKKSSRFQPAVAPPTGLKQLAALLKRCAVVVSNDSGPMHLSVAVGTRTVGLHGPSDPSVSGAYGNWSIAVMGERINELECYLPEKRKLRCRRFRKCGSSDCMGLISSEEVFKKIWDILYAEKKR